MRTMSLRAQLDLIGRAMDLRAKGLVGKTVQARVGCENRGDRWKQK